MNHTARGRDSDLGRERAPPVAPEGGASVGAPFPLLLVGVAASSIHGATDHDHAESDEHLDEAVLVDVLGSVQHEPRREDVKAAPECCDAANERGKHPSTSLVLHDRCRETEHGECADASPDQVPVDEEVGWANEEGIAFCACAHEYGDRHPDCGDQETDH